MGGERLSDTDRIDHKDEPGAYRIAVFAEVQRRIGWSGETPEDRSFCEGDWVYRFAPFNPSDESPAFAYVSFFSDGAASSRAVDGTWHSPANRWAFNDNRSFSYWSYIEPMPQYGIDEPTYSEDRYHVLTNGRREFVLFNGDGSLVQVYTRLESRL